jgi:hypothetical protein
MSMSSKDVRIARRDLLKEGVIVDSGKRDIQTGHVVWTLSEEERQRVIQNEKIKINKERWQSLAVALRPAPSSTVSLDPAVKIPSKVQTKIMSRLFGAGRWFAYEDEIPRLFKLIMKTGLAELVPGQPKWWQATVLGKQVGVDLLVIFLGIFDAFEAAEILANHGFMDDREVDRIWETLFTDPDPTVVLFRGSDPEAVLKPVVRAAYRRFEQRGEV